MESVEHKIERHIIKRGRDKVYLVDDFLRYGSEGAVRLALMRLAKKEMVVRVANGIYAYPKIDTQYGMGVILPSTDRIAQLIAKRDKARIAPTGANALHILGLSTQVPTNIVYLTDGTERKVKVYNHTIKFILTSPKNLSYKSSMMQLVVAALKEIGNNNVSEEDVKKIKTALNKVSKEIIEQDLTLAPVWIRKIIKEVV
ncbi:MAG: DUF6088 family protein [Rikenellaceae bacterium]